MRKAWILALGVLFACNNAKEDKKQEQSASKDTTQNLPKKEVKEETKVENLKKDSADKTKEEIKTTEETVIEEP